jgi:hypothetical protein
MSVFRLAKNNRNRNDIGVTMSYKTFDEYLHKAQQEKVEEIVKLLKREMYDISCCCDTASFGDHYLSHMQPDNLINLIMQTIPTNLAAENSAVE